MLTHKTRMRGASASFSSLYFCVGLVLLAGLILALRKEEGVPGTSIAPARLETFTNADYGYSFSYPSGWQIIDQSNKAVVSLAANLDGKATSGGTNFSRRKLVDPAVQAVPSTGFSKLDVLAYGLETPLTSQEFMLARSSVAPEGLISPLTIAGLAAIRVESSTAVTLQHTGESVNYISIFVSSGTTGYIIAGFAQPAEFDAILASFQFN